MDAIQNKYLQLDVYVFNINSTQPPRLDLLSTGHPGKDVIPVQAQRLLSDDVTQLSALILSRICIPVIIVFGVGANLINVNIFARIGLHDCVGIALFILSVSDLTFLLIMAAATVTNIMSSFSVKSVVGLFDLNYVLLWYAKLFYYNSVLVTVYLSVQRSCCVAFPFRFKGVFTNSRSYKIHALLFLSCLATCVPLFATVQLKMTLNPQTNATEARLWYGNGKDAIMAVNDILNRTIIYAISQVVTLAAMIVFAVELRSSVRFAQNFTTSRNEDSNIVKVTQMSKTRLTDAANVKKFRVIKSVALVSVVFVVCNTASVSVAITKRVMPTFVLNDPVYGNVYRVVAYVQNFCEYVNASVNIFIYFSVNLKYKEKFVSLLNAQC